MANPLRTWLEIPGLQQLNECPAAVPGVAKSQARLSDFTFTLHFHALEKEMATHSSVLAWRIPGMEKPGGLPSIGSQSQTRMKQLSSNSIHQRNARCQLASLNLSHPEVREGDILP